MTRPAAATVLEDLAAMGIVRSSSAGQANVHLLEHRSIYVQRLIAPLFDAEQQLSEDLESDLLAAFGTCAESIVLFGSYARGDQRADSDVDVVLVAADPTSKSALDRTVFSYSQEFRSRYGATLSAITYEAREANVLWRTAPALLESLKREGVVVSGRGPWEWVNDEQG